MNELTVSKTNQELFLADLKQKTADSHNELEENYYSKAILEPTVTNADYQNYLAKLYGIILACEKDVYPSLSPILPDLDKRYKSVLMAADMEKTGMPVQLISNLPVYNFKFSSIAEALGIMYVLEGSTLGGRILYQHIHKNLGWNEENGASYFWGYGQQTGMLWKAFISSFANYAVEESSEDIIISSAIETFSKINNWLTEAEING